MHVHNTLDALIKHPFPSNFIHKSKIYSKYLLKMSNFSNKKWAILQNLKKDFIMDALRYCKLGN